MLSHFFQKKPAHALLLHNAIIFWQQRCRLANTVKMEKVDQPLSLRKNSCLRSQKRSGRKRPRPGDCDVTAALDAATKLKELKLATDDGEYALTL